MKRMKLLFTLALPVFLLQNAQAQSGSRLTSQSHWSNNSTVFVPVDSTAFTYNDSSRGGDLTHQLKFDVSNTWLATDSNSSKKSIQTFNTDETLNSTSNLSLNSLGGYDNVNRYNYFYGAHGVSSMIYQTGSTSTWTNFSKNVYTYDATGRKITDQLYYWTGTDFSTFVSQKTYQYDAISGMVTSETDANNGSAGLTYSQQYIYSYDSVHTSWLTSTQFNTWNGSAFVPSTLYTYAYDTMGNKVTTTYQVYDATSGAWMNTTLKIYSGFTSAHNPTSETDQKWDTTGSGHWYNATQYAYTYNSHNQMTSMVGESWNIAGFWQYANGDAMAMYHYSGFWGTGVAPVNAAAGTVNIFPVPVQNTVSIDLKWNEAQSFSVMVFDMSGRLMNSWNVPATMQYNTTIATDTYPTGNYIVKIAGAQGQMTKEFVVAH